MYPLCLSHCPLCPCMYPLCLSSYYVPACTHCVCLLTMFLHVPLCLSPYHVLACTIVSVSLPTMSLHVSIVSVSLPIMSLHVPIVSPYPLCPCMYPLCLSPYPLCPCMYPLCLLTHYVPVCTHCVSLSKGGNLNITPCTGYTFTTLQWREIINKSLTFRCVGIFVKDVSLYPVVATHNDKMTWRQNWRRKKINFKKNKSLMTHYDAITNQHMKHATIQSRTQRNTIEWFSM